MTRKKKKKDQSKGFLYRLIKVHFRMNKEIIEKKVSRGGGGAGAAVPKEVIFEYRRFVLFCFE